jgi:hypothetical protein
MKIAIPAFKGSNLDFWILTFSITASTSSGWISAKILLLSFSISA